MGKDHEIESQVSSIIEDWLNFSRVGCSFRDDSGDQSRADKLAKQVDFVSQEIFPFWKDEEAFSFDTLTRDISDNPELMALLLYFMSIASPQDKNSKSLKPGFYGWMHKPIEIGDRISDLRYYYFDLISQLRASKIFSIGVATGPRTSVLRSVEQNPDLLALAGVSIIYDIIRCSQSNACNENTQKVLNNSVYAFLRLAETDNSYLRYLSRFYDMIKHI